MMDMVNASKNLHLQINENKPNSKRSVMKGNSHRERADEKDIFSADDSPPENSDMDVANSNEGLSDSEASEFN